MYEIIKYRNGCTDKTRGNLQIDYEITFIIHICVYMNQITYIYILIKNTSEAQFDKIVLIIFIILVNKISLIVT